MCEAETDKLSVCEAETDQLSVCEAVTDQLSVSLREPCLRRFSARSHSV